ncbi:MAG: class F sortase [Dehalococcoidia bacterium]
MSGRPKRHGKGSVIASLALAAAGLLLAVGIYGFLRSGSADDDGDRDDDIDLAAGEDGPKGAPITKRLVIAALSLAAAAILLGVGVYAYLLGGFGSDDGAVSAQIVKWIPTPKPTPSPSPSDAPPARLVIDSIGVDAPIATLSLDSENFPEVPDGPDVVAWYNFSRKPGHGSNAVFSGHVSWTVDGQAVTAVFWPLKDVEEGDVVKVALKDGTEYRYKVTLNTSVPWDDPNGVNWILGTPDEVITLVTCGGTWVPDPSQRLGGNYTHRVIVRAEPVADAAAASVGTR